MPGQIWRHLETGETRAVASNVIWSAGDLGIEIDFGDDKPGAVLIDAGVQSLGRPKVLFKYSSEHYPCSSQGQANALLCDIKSRRSYVPTFFTVIVQQGIRMIHVDKPDFISVFR